MIAAAPTYGDLPAGGRPVTLVWIKRVWRCMEPDCPRQTWTETSEHIRPRASLTERARREACRRVGQDGETVARVAAQYGCGWQAIMNAVREYGLPLVDDPQRLDGVRRLGVDETAFLAANAYHSTSFITGVVDLTGRVARLLDVVDGRSGKALCDWVSERSTAWRDAVTVAALDPFRGYATALSTSLPGARCGCSMPSMSPGSGSPPSTRCAAGCSRIRPGTAAAHTTRCTGSAACCADVPTGSVSWPGDGC